MTDHLDVERNVNAKYLHQELQIQARLRQLSQTCAPENEAERKQLEQQREKERKQAEKRNKDLIKNLELKVARLRTRSLYSPTDEHLEAAKEKYLKALQNLNPADDSDELN